MKIEQAINIQSTATKRLMDIFSAGKVYHLDNMALTHKFIELKKSLPKKTPYYVHTYLSGYRDALIAELYKYHLEFCYDMGDGKLVSTYRKSERYYEKMNVQISELTDKPCSYYWIGTNKQF
jgi:hypothetical protein